MADQEKSVTIVIRGKNLSKEGFDAARKELAGFDADTLKASKSGETLGQSFKENFAAAATAAVAAGAAIYAVVRIGQDFVAASNAQEDAVVALNAALQAQGTYTPQLSAQYQALGASFQKTTIYGDELIEEMEALLVSIGGVMPEQMGAALTASTDLAAALGIDLRSATLLVGKAFAGETGSLTRYGIVIDQAKLKTDGAGAVMDAIAAKMGGRAAAAAKTFSGQLKQLDNTTGDVKETLGAFIGRTLQPAIGLFMDLPEPVRTGAIAFGLLGTAGVALGAAVAATAAAIALAAPLFGMTAAAVGAGALGTLGAAFSATAAAALPLAAAIGAVWGAWKLGNTETVKNTVASWALSSENLTAKLSRLVLGIEKLTPEQARAAVTATAAAAASAKLAHAHEQAAPPVQRVAEAMRDYTRELSQAAKEAAAVDGPTRRQIAAAQDLGVKTEELTKRFGLSEQALKILASQQRAHTAVVKQGTSAQQKFLDSISSAPAVFVPYATALADAGDELQNIARGLEGNGTLMTAALQDTADAAEAAADWAFQNGAVLAPSIAKVGSEIDHTEKDVESFSATLGRLSSAFVQLAQVTGGGNGVVAWLGSVTAAMNLASAASKTMREGLDQGGAAGFAKMGAGAISAVGSIMAVTNTASKAKNVLGGMASGAMAGASFGPWGMVAGGVIGGVIGLFRKTNQEVVAANLEIGKVRDALLATYGPLDTLEAKAQAVGLSFKENWGHQGKAGLEAMNTLAQEFKTRWDALNESLVTSQGALDALLKQSADLGYEFDQSGNLIQISFQKMQEAAQKYGVDLGSLGPAFQGQRLHASAEQIINDFTLLTKGGASVGGVLVGMKDEISQLVQDSIKFGTDIPENMRPWIENLIETGQLTDENGVKITDLAGIQFGAPMATQFETITTKIGEMIDKIGELVDRLSTTLGPAVDSLTRDRSIHVGFHVDDPPEIHVKGGGDNSRGFARGTFGTLGIDFPDFGQGTQTVLHQREAVVPYEDREAFARRVLGSSARDSRLPAPAQAPVNVYIVGDTSREARQVSEAEFRQIQDRLNGGGLTVPVRAISQRGR